jgi:hypothetical protein
MRKHQKLSRKTLCFSIVNLIYKSGLRPCADAEAWPSVGSLPSLKFRRAKINTAFINESFLDQGADLVRAPTLKLWRKRP